MSIATHGKRLPSCQRKPTKQMQKLRSAALNGIQFYYHQHLPRRTCGELLRMSLLPHEGELKSIHAVRCRRIHLPEVSSPRKPPLKHSTKCDISVLQSCARITPPDNLQLDATRFMLRAVSDDIFARQLCARTTRMYDYVAMRHDVNRHQEPHVDIVRQRC